MPFKKGPDYIDPAWHSLAAGSPSHNLDPFLMEGDQIRCTLYARHAQAADALLIEGNRGLYDGLDAQGTYSTAELAKLLAVPVVLVVDCTMTTRTTAALVLGCQHFDPQVPIRRRDPKPGGPPPPRRHPPAEHRALTAGSRCWEPSHASSARCFPSATWGSYPPGTPGRGAGRGRGPGHGRALPGSRRALAGGHPGPAPPRRPAGPLYPAPTAQPQVHIGIIRDAAFQFYYPENLEALEQAGARLMFINALADPELPPDLDALYIGGGFPETQRRPPWPATRASGLRCSRPPHQGFAHLRRMRRPHVPGAGHIQTHQGESHPMVGSSAL